MNHPRQLNHPPSRRNVLKGSAAALGAALGAPLILRGAPAATTANSKMNFAIVGCGGQGRHDMKGIISAGANVVAFCDPDPKQLQTAQTDAQKMSGDAVKSAKAVDDYRKLLEDASKFDAVLVGTPDHWHAPICKAFMKAGKHIYCEKPLTHSVAEARELRELSRTSKVVTQMGNQGSASISARRCIEVIQAGALGQIREIYQWGIGVTASEGNAQGEDPVPPGFNWDLWVGTSAMRPFKKDVYHPFRWRGWFDFGNGGLADFCCHAINMPMRALNLSYPEKLVLNMKDGKVLPNKAAVELHFPARGKLAPLTFHWQGSGKPPEEIMKPLVEVYPEKTPNGVLVIGENGVIYTSHWNTGGLLRLKGEPKLKDITRHEATKDIPQTLPRVKSHFEEWIAACRGEGKTSSNFETGGLLTEIGLAAVVAVRAGKSLDWDGEKMQAKNAPEAAKFVKTDYRAKWLS